MATVPSCYEFIVLCEARDEGARDMRLVDHDGGWRYRVMLVEPKFDAQYFERVSIGSVGLILARHLEGWRGRSLFLADESATYRLLAEHAAGPQSEAKTH